MSASDPQYDAQRLFSSVAQLQPVAPMKETTEVVGSRPVQSLAQFCSGSLAYRVNVDADKVWKPKQSYFRLRARVQVEGDIQRGVYISSVVDENQKFISRRQFHVDLDGKQSSLALAYNAPSTLFREIQVNLKAQPISVCDNVAEQDTAAKRLLPRELQRTLTPYLVSDFWARHKAISSDVDFESKTDEELKIEYRPHSDSGIPSGSEVEMLWQPSIGILNQETLPPGSYEIVIRPMDASSIKNSFVQSLHEAQADYTVEIVDFRFYATFEESGMASLANKTVVLDHIEQDLQRKQILSSGISSHQWEARKDLVGVLLAFQGNRGFSSFGPKYPRTCFTSPSVAQQAVEPGDSEVALKTLYLKVDNRTYPKERYHLPDGAGAHAVYNQLYMDNLNNTGNVLMQTPAEGIDAFYDLGPYAYWQLKLNGLCPAQLETHHSFAPSAEWDAMQPNAVLISRYRKITTIKYDGLGAVAQVLQS